MTGEDILTRPVEPIKKRLQCPICRDLMKEPTTSTECMHSFCRDCIEQALDTDKQYVIFKCPCCARELGGAPFHTGRLLYDRQLDELLTSLFPRPQLDEALKKRREEREAMMKALMKPAAAPQSKASRAANPRTHGTTRPREDAAVAVRAPPPKKPRPAAPPAPRPAPAAAAAPKQAVAKKPAAAEADEAANKVQFYLLPFVLPEDQGKAANTFTTPGEIGPCPALDLPYLRIRRDLQVKTIKQYVLKKASLDGKIPIDEFEFVIRSTSEAVWEPRVIPKNDLNVGILSDKFKLLVAEHAPVPVVHVYYRVKGYGQAATEAAGGPLDPLAM